MEENTQLPPQLSQNPELKQNQQVDPAITLIVKSRSRFPLASVIGIFLFLLIIVGFIGFYVFRQQENESTTKTGKVTKESLQTPTIELTKNYIVYSGTGYTIKYPPNFKVQKNEKVNSEQFYLPLIISGNEIIQESVTITRKNITETDVCNMKIDGYPSQICIKIGNQTFLDWKSENMNASEPMNFRYSAISEGMLYDISFEGIDKDKKDQILSTILFTEISVDAASRRTFTNVAYGFSFRYPPNWTYKTSSSTASILNRGTKQFTYIFGEYSTRNMEGNTVPQYIVERVVLNIVTYPTRLNSDIKSYVDTKTLLDPTWSDLSFNEIAMAKVEHHTCSSGECEDILIPKNNTIINFRTQNGGSENILSSFKFNRTNL